MPSSPEKYARLIKRYAAAALADGEGRILLGLRCADRAFYPGVWDFVGEHCYDGEDFEQAMLREVREETGAQATAYQRVLTIDRSPVVMLHLFLVTAWEGNISNHAPQEHERLAWFSLKNARSLPLPEPEYAALFDALELATAAGPR